MSFLTPYDGSGQKGGKVTLERDGQAPIELHPLVGFIGMFLGMLASGAKIRPHWDSDDPDEGDNGLLSDLPIADGGKTLALDGGQFYQPKPVEAKRMDDHELQSRYLARIESLEEIGRTGVTRWIKAMREMSNPLDDKESRIWSSGVIGAELYRQLHEHYSAKLREIALRLAAAKS